MMLTQTIINENSTVLDKLTLGGETLLLGMIAIFAILFIIYLVIKVLGMTINKESKSENKKANNVDNTPVINTKPVHKSAPAPVAAPSKQPAAETSSAANTVNDGELIAVIAAAISACSGEPVTKFRVVSFKHIK